MKAKGCSVTLHNNEPGFTLPSNIGELGNDITTLDLSQCSLQGAFCSASAYTESGRKLKAKLRNNSHAECSSRLPVYRHHPDIDRRAEQPADPAARQESPHGYVCFILCMFSATQKEAN